MKNYSKELVILSKEMPESLSRESIKDLTQQNLVSFEVANESLMAIEAYQDDLEDEEETLSKESFNNKIDDITGLDVSKNTTLKGIEKQFKHTKLEMMLENCKETNKNLYDEYVNISEALQNITQEIEKNSEYYINSSLSELKTISGVNFDIIDKIIQTKVSMNDFTM